MHLLPLWAFVTCYRANFTLPIYSYRPSAPRACSGRTMRGGRKLIMGKHNSCIFVSSCNYLPIKAWEAWGDGNTVQRILNFLARWIFNYTLLWSVIRAVFRWISRCRWGGSRNCINSELISKFRLIQKVNTVFSKQSIPTGCTTEEQWLDSRLVQEILIFP